jgi:hypothetical protein
MSTAQPVDSGLHGLMDYAEVDRTLNRGLGVGSILFMVVAAAAPMSVVAGSMPVLIGVSDSTGMPVYYLMSTLVLILFSVGYVSMSKYVRNAGAFYSYVQAGLGRMVGVGASALAVLAYLALNIGVYAYFGIAGRTLSRVSPVERSTYPGGCSRWCASPWSRCSATATSRSARRCSASCSSPRRSSCS